MGGLSVRDPLPTRACTRWRASAQPAGAGFVGGFCRGFWVLARGSRPRDGHIGQDVVEQGQRSRVHAAAAAAWAEPATLSRIPDHIPLVAGGAKELGQTSGQDATA
jgi:hypothetical protein